MPRRPMGRLKVIAAIVSPIVPMVVGVLTYLGLSPVGIGHGCAGRSRPQSAQPTGDGSVPPTQAASLRNADSSYRPRPLPHEIHNAIDRYPVAMKENARANYVGLRIRWRLALYNITTDAESTWLFMHEKGYILPGISAPIDCGVYPEVRTMMSDQELWVTGTIAYIDGLGIMLTNCHFEFD